MLEREEFYFHYPEHPLSTAFFRRTSTHLFYADGRHRRLLEGSVYIYKKWKERRVAALYVLLKVGRLF